MNNRYRYCKFENHEMPLGAGGIHSRSIAFGLHTDAFIGRWQGRWQGIRFWSDNGDGRIYYWVLSTQKVSAEFIIGCGVTSPENNFAS